jgi:hypothetical protein
VAGVHLRARGVSWSEARHKSRFVTELGRKSKVPFAIRLRGTVLQVGPSAPGLPPCRDSRYQRAPAPQGFTRLGNAGNVSFRVFFTGQPAVPRRFTPAWTRCVHDADERGIGTVRYPRLVAKDEQCAKLLAARTLTNLYNQRPTWLDLAHRKLDEAVFAAYDWPADLNDAEVLDRLARLESGAKITPRPALP